MEVYLISHSQLPVEYLLTDGDLKTLLELLNSLTTDDLKHLLEVNFVEGCFNGVDMERSLSFGLVYDFLLSEQPEGRNEADLYGLFYRPIVVEPGEIGELQYIVIFLVN